VGSGSWGHNRESNHRWGGQDTDARVCNPWLNLTYYLKNLLPLSPLLSLSVFTESWTILCYTAKGSLLHPPLPSPPSLTHTHTHARTHTHTHTHRHTHTQTHRHTDTHTHTDTQTHTHTQTHRHTDTQTHARTHAHTHTHTVYKCKLPLERLRAPSIHNQAWTFTGAGENHRGCVCGERANRGRHQLWRCALTIWNEYESSGERGRGANNNKRGWWRHFCEFRLETF